MRKNGELPTPVKPVVVGDRLFTNTSKRWISTANLRADMMLVRQFKNFDSGKRNTRQKHDYNMRIFKEYWNRALDKSRLTKRPEKKKEVKKKKEIAAYLRDVYSDSSTEEDNDDNRLESLSRKTGKKSERKKKLRRNFSTSSAKEGTDRFDGDSALPSVRTPSVASSCSSFALSSIASLSKYLPEEAAADAKKAAQELDQKPITKTDRPVRSASGVRTPVKHPPLRHRTSKSFSGPAWGSVALLNPEPEVPAIAEVKDDSSVLKTNDEDDTTKEHDVMKESKSGLLEVNRADDAKSTASSAVTKYSVDSATFELSRLHLKPHVLPPMYTVKPRKPAVRPWDYPFAGVVKGPPELLEKPEEDGLHEQLAGLKHCRYLRLAPRGGAKAKKERRPVRRKEMIYVVAAGREYKPDDRIIPVAAEAAVGKWMKKTGLTTSKNVVATEEETKEPAEA